MTFPDLIFAELQRRNISLRKLAEMAGVDASTLSKIINDGYRPSPKTVRKMAPLLGKSEDELLTLVGHRSSEQRPSRPRTPADMLADLQRSLPIAVPVYDQPVSAGPGEPAIQEYLYLPPDVGLNPNWYGLPVRGACMDPVLLPGDVVVVNPDAVPEPGDMVVANIDGEQALVKWFVKHNGDLFLEPEIGEPIPYDETRVRIIGVVMTMWRNIRSRPRRELRRRLQR